MNRHIMTAMGVAFVSLISTGAEAATGKWCFVWNVEYGHNNRGEDRLTDNSANAPARYTYVTITGPSTCDEYFLDSAGCTPTVTISPSTTYHFYQYTRAQRLSRDAYAMKDNENWYSTNTYYSHWYWTTGSYLISPFLKTFGPPPLVPQTRIMPVVGEMMYWANTLDWTGDNDVWVSFDPDAPTYCSQDRCGGSSGDYRICLGADQDHKFGMAHEFGHMISKSQSAADPGAPEGSEGVFRDPVDGDPATGDHHCDSTYLGDDSHNLTSREFTGMAQKEGFSQFIASATFNEREATGRLVYGKRMMKWSSSHDSALTWPILLPPTWPAYLDHPIDIDLDSGNVDGENVRWVMYECDPSGDDFVHYGTEWDWMELYWNLWVDASNPFSISEIDNIWSGTYTSSPVNDQIAYFCCDVDGSGIPTDCDPRNKSYECDTAQNPNPEELEVGKLWEDDADFGVTVGLLDTVESTYGYGSAKYNLFFNLGDDTKVNY